MARAIFASAAASLLLTIAFALAVSAITSHFWAIRSAYEPGSDPPNLTGHVSRSPFSECSRNLGDSKWTCTTTKKPGGLCSAADQDSMMLCQALRVSGQLLIASNVLLGVGFLSSFGLVAVSIGASGIARRIMSVFVFLMAATGSACMALAHLAGVLALLVMQFPNPEDGTSIGNGNTLDFLSTWTGHSGMSIAAACWVLAAASAAFTAMTPGWGERSDGPENRHPNHDHDHHHHHRGHGKD